MVGNILFMLFIYMIQQVGAGSIDIQLDYLEASET